LALLESGADLHAEDAEWRCVLHHYANGGESAEEFQNLVPLGLDPKKAYKNGNTLLHIAVRCYAYLALGNFDFVRLLLSFGISPSTKNSFGDTPAHIYVWNPLC
jgi:ankyrin repeat protein